MFYLSSQFQSTSPSTTLSEMHLRSSHGLSNAVLLSEVPFLLVTLGLMAWAISILSGSISKWKDNDNLAIPRQQTTSWMPPVRACTQVLTETVTGFETSFVSVPNFTASAIPYDSVYADGTTRYTTTYTTHSGYTTQYGSFTYGVSPTATSTRTVTVTAFQVIGHFKLPDEDQLQNSTPTITPAPTAIVKARANPSDVTIRYPYDESTTTYSYVKYRTVHANGGFAANFIETGINYIFNSEYENNNGPALSRLAALTSLISLALLAILCRLFCTAVRFVLKRRSQRESRKNSGAEGLTSGFNLASTILLIMTYVPFWAIYGSWTNRNRTIQQADAAYEKDPYLISLGLNYILHTTPWQGTTVALIVFWTLIILTSSAVSIVMLVDWHRNRTSKADDHQSDHTDEAAKGALQSITSSDTGSN